MQFVFRKRRFCHEKTSQFKVERRNGNYTAVCEFIQRDPVEETSKKKREAKTIDVFITENIKKKYIEYTRCSVEEPTKIYQYTKKICRFVYRTPCVWYHSSSFSIDKYPIWNFQILPFTVH